MMEILKKIFIYESPEVTPMVIEKESTIIVGGCYSVDRSCNGSSNGCGAKLSTDTSESDLKSNVKMLRIVQLA